jgi:protein-disulfide isomerase/Skp family chaperone for outer membrane proteins
MKQNLIFVLMISFTLPGFVFGQANSKPLAVVNGETITESDVQKEAADELEKLDAKRLQFETGWQRERQNAIGNQLNEMIEDRVLTAEAKKRGLTTDKLVAEDVESKVKKPTDDDVVKFYEQNKSRINGSLAETAKDIQEYLFEQERDRLFASYVDGLKKTYKVTSYYDPPRTTVATQGFPSRGPANATVTIVEFSDFECPFCGGLYPTLKEIESKYKDKIRIVYRQFPLTSIHPHAQKAAEAALCANDQDKFWQMHDAMFTDQRNLEVTDLKAKAEKLSLNTATFNTCLDSNKYAGAIRSEIIEGSKVGVSGTPAMFINGRFLSGNQPYDDIAKVIDDELTRAAAKP